MLTTPNDVTGGPVDTTLVDPVSSSAFGGGASGQGNGAAPETLVNVTPPGPPQGEVGPLEGKPGSLQRPYSFSPKTCLELLKKGALSDDQLEFERGQLKALGHDIDTRSRLSTSKAVVVKALEDQLVSQICLEYGHDARKYVNLVNHFSCTVASAAAELERLTTAAAAAPPVTPAATLPPLDEVATDTPTALYSPEQVPIMDPSVCTVRDFDTADFRNLTVDDVMRQLTIDPPASNGSRSTAYFGKVAYSYGHMKHEPLPYPDCQVFSDIFDRMASVDPDFSRESFTCLVTLYKDGRSTIPPHSDNESQIVADSTIYTISVGATRSLVLQNQVGVISETRVALPHGSMYTMSRESQSSWKHSIAPDESVTTPRISFTFRRLIPLSELPSRPRAPPITHPDHYSSPNSPPRGTHERVLLLTDSILASTPTHIFDKVESHRCIKKVNKRLVDIFGFEHEFRFTSTVIISCGVNDLACYGLRAHVLADMVTGKLADTCRRHPGTTFIYNSVLHTRYHRWLNNEIDAFNRIMFELSFHVPNLKFFDSHEVLRNDRLSRRTTDVIQASDPRGTHITHPARHLISDHLVMAADDVDCGRKKKALTPRLRRWSWPIRQEFRDLIPDIRGRLHDSREASRFSCFARAAIP
jgi:alkylated DNA repair dioxygenase AlkB